MVVYASFEDFIYIILGLAWVIYSAYNAKKKQKAKNNPAPSSQNKSFLESVISEIGFPEEKPEPITSSLSNDAYYNEEDIDPEINPSTESAEIFSYDDEYEEGNFNSSNDIIENEQVIKSNKIISNYIIPKKDSNLNKKTTKKRIDLRKAVIYSEILKKVYF